MTALRLDSVLAVGTGDKGAHQFLGSSIGRAVVAISGVVALITLLFTAFHAYKNFSSGRPGEGIKAIIYGFIGATLMFDLNLTISGVNVMSKLVQKAFDSFGTITN